MAGGVWQRNIVDEAGNVVPNATLEVRHQSTGVLASIFSDYELTTTLSNPTTADENGFVRFFAASGLYRITASANGFVREWIYEPIGPLLDNQLVEDIGHIQDSIEDHAQEIADNIADINRAGEVLLENQMRLLRIGRPVDGYTKFELDTTNLVLPDGVSLQQQFNTIENNNELIAQSIALLGAKSEDGSSFILDLNTVKVSGSPQVTLGQKFTEITSVIDDLDVDALASAVQSLTSTVSDHDGLITANAEDILALEAVIEDEESGLSAVAQAVESLSSTVSSHGDTISSHTSSISSLSSTVGGHTSTITSLQETTGNLTGDIASLQARQGVALNVNGFVTGYVQFNDGSTGNFDILANSFRVVDPASGGQNPKQVFTVTGGNVYMQNVYIDGDAIVDGTVTANKIAVDGDIEVQSTGRIIFSDGNYMKVSGIGFGTDNQFLEWYGPVMPISSCSEDNGLLWLKSDGSTHYGGIDTIQFNSAARTGSFGIYNGFATQNINGNIGGASDVVTAFGSASSPAFGSKIVIACFCTTTGTEYLKLHLLGQLPNTDKGSFKWIEVNGHTYQRSTATHQLAAGNITEWRWASAATPAIPSSGSVDLIITY